MDIADAVLAHAAETERGYGAPVLALRIDSPLGRPDVAQRTRVAIATLEGTDEVYWSVDEEPAGVIVRQWGHASDIGAVLAALSRALGSAGVGGRMAVHTPEPLDRPTPMHERHEELLECHVRVRGGRRLQTRDEHAAGPTWTGRSPDPPVGFFPDDDALLAGIDAALAWIGNPPPGAGLWSYGDLPHTDIGEVRAQLAETVAYFGTARWRLTWSGWWASDDRFRVALVKFASGDVSFVEGGARLAAGDWEPAYSALLDELRAGFAWGSYGLIKRGREPGWAGNSLMYDWVPALHYGSSNLTHHIYEDVFAPDAFGAQLLGPGYAGRIPEGGEWERVDVSSDASLLLHRDPAAWFGERLPAITQGDSYRRDPAYPTPEVILRAREAFADILITADVVHSAPIDPLRA